MDTAWATAALELVNGVPTTGTPAATSSPSVSQIVANIPSPATGTSEDCLFLDVIVPEKIYNSRYAEGERASQNGTKVDCGDAKGGELLFGKLRELVPDFFQSSCSRLDIWRRLRLW